MIPFAAPAFRTRLLTGLTLILPLLAFPAFPQPTETPLPKIRPAQPLSAETGAEIDPAVSPDGKWLAYASDRSGNYDIWVRPVSGGAPLALTTHPADDYRPAWSPDGRKICFVSRREDPDGDIYVLDFSTSLLRSRRFNPRRLSAQPGRQDHPSYHRRGKAIVFQDGSGSRARLVLFDTRTRKSVYLTSEGYLNPSFSPLGDRILAVRKSPEGDAREIVILDIAEIKRPQPTERTVYRGTFPVADVCWSPAGNDFVAALVSRDRDGDGELTGGDGQTLYRFTETDGIYRYRPITLGPSSASFPHWAVDGMIYYADDARGSYDLHRISADGPVPRCATAETALRLARSVGGEAELEGRPLTERERLLKGYAYDRIRWDFPGERFYAAQSLLEGGRLLRSAGLRAKAQYYLKTLLRLYPDQEEVLAEGIIDYQMDVHDAFFDSAGVFHCAQPASLIPNLQAIISRFPAQRSAVARALTVIGAAQELLGDADAALATYQDVVDEYPDAGDYPALSLLRTGSLYARLGGGGEALEVYLREIREFSHRPDPTEEAIARVIRLKVTGDDPIAGLQDLIGEHSDLPALAAAAQKQIADHLAAQGEDDLALLEYDRLRGWVNRSPTLYVRRLGAEGLLEAAELHYRRGETVLAQKNLREIEKTAADISQGYYARRARRRRVDMLRERAERLSAQGDYELALALFDQALELDPKNVSLIRGTIAAAQARGLLDVITRRFRERYREDPEEAEAAYALGLCLSYQGETRPALLGESNRLIQRALALQPDLTAGYLTLGYNYQLAEELNRGGKVRRGFFSRLTGALASVFRSGGTESGRGFERAIEILQLGIAVNDEGKNPDLEAKLLLNLGNDYYRLGEYGYPRALAAYLRMLDLDSTFTSPEQEAVIRERMGRTAAFTERYDIAAENYRRARALYHDQKRYPAELRVVLRLAELFQVRGDAEESNRWYREALTLSEREGLGDSFTRWWGNMALNALQSGDDEQALTLARRALSQLPPDREIPPPEIENPLILEILGIELPLWNFGYLGTGSPISELGFSAREERLLNYSVAEEVYDRRKEPPLSADQASRRLAAVIHSGDREAEAVLWSLLGWYAYQEGDVQTARDDFVRSYNLFRESGNRGGVLSALVNIACCDLQETDRRTPEKERLGALIGWFRDYEIGYPAEVWEKFSREIAAADSLPDAGEMKRLLRRALAGKRTKGKAANPRFDADLVSRLLLLQNDLFPDTPSLIRNLEREIRRFEADPVGFSRERVRVLELYAKLCWREASRRQDNSVEDVLRRYAYGGSALWALKEGITTAERRGLPEMKLRLRLNLCDFYEAVADRADLADELETALNESRALGDDAIRWRVYWRVGRYLLENGADAGRFADASPLDWFNRALELWDNLPDDPQDLGGATLAKAEFKRMLSLAATAALREGNPDDIAAWAQTITSEPLLQEIRSRRISVNREKRKVIWGDGGGSVPYYRRVTAQLKRRLAETTRETSPDSAAVEPEVARLRRLEAEYRELLAQVRREDPEFASLFSLLTFPVDTIRAVLNPGEAALQLIRSGGSLYGLWLDEDTVAVFTITGKKENEVARTVRRLREMTMRTPGLDRLFLLVPPGGADLSGLEAELRSGASPAPLPIYRLPDLQSLVFLASKRSPGRGEAFSLAEGIETDALKAALPGDDDALSNLFSRAGTIFIAPDTASTGAELDRVILRGAGSEWRVKDLFRLDTQAEALIVLGHVKNEAVFVRAAFFAGFANVIFLPANAPREALLAWLEVFLRTKSDASVGESFYAACAALGEENDEPGFSTARIYGDGGLDPEEKIAFARERFTATVQKGNLNLQRGDGEWALRYYRRALALAEETGDRAARRNLYNLIIRAAKAAGKWEEAIAAQQALIADAEKRGDLKDAETGQRNLSVYFSKAGRFGEAARARLQAREKAVHRGDELRAAKDDRFLALTYERAGDLPSALAAIRAAADIFRDREETESYLSCRIYQARILMALEDFSGALRILLETASDEEMILPAEYYQHLGLAYEGLNDYENARRAYLDALNAVVEEPTPVSALTHQYLAGVYWKSGRYREGLDQIAVAKRQFEALHLQRYYYLCQNAEALIYLSIGDADRALESAKQALEGAIRAQDTKSRSQIEKNIGLILLSVGEPEKARDRFSNALELDLQTGSTRNRAYAFLDLGGAYLQMNEADSAEISFREAIHLGERLSERRVLAKAWLGMGWVALRRGEAKTAAQALRRAADISDSLGAEELLWRVDLALGEAAERQGDFERATEALQRAMERVERMRASLTLESRRAGFMEDKQEIYQRAALIHLKRGETEAAFDVVERARSRSFLDLVGGRKSVETAGLDSTAKALVTRLSQRSTVLERELSLLRYKGSARTSEEDARLDTLQIRLDSLKSAWAEELDRIETEHPGYRDLVSVRPASAGEIQALLEPGEVLIEYYLLRESLAAFVMTPDRIYARVIPVSPDSLGSLTARLRRRLEKKLDIAQEAQALHGALIAPLSRWIAGGSRLIVIPAGVLHYLPFALLQDAKGSELIDLYSISYAPSANLFAFCRRRARERPWKGDAPAAFGDPRSDLPLENLFFSGKEIESLAAVYPETRLFRGEKAEEAAVFAVGERSGALHIAAHGVTDARTPSFSSLFLAPGEGADGRLHMFEIFGLNLPRCQWVTLSACESGLGGLAGGDEIVGFNRAFIYAGSPRVIASLWKVDDLATAILMKHFYRGLRRGDDPVEALRRAQITVRDRFRKHPFYWAAFVLTGEATGSFPAQAASSSSAVTP